MKELFVYMIRCSDGNYYTGVTNDVEKLKGRTEEERGVDQSGI